MVAVFGTMLKAIAGVSRLTDRTLTALESKQGVTISDSYSVHATAIPTSHRFSRPCRITSLSARTPFVVTILAATVPAIPVPFVPVN